MRTILSDITQLLGERSWMGQVRAEGFGGDLYRSDLGLIMYILVPPMVQLQAKVEENIESLCSNILFY